MIEVLSELTQAEWLGFNEKYFKYTSKSKRRRALILLVVYAFLVIIYGVNLFTTFDFYLNVFPVSLPVAEILSILADKILLTFIFCVFLCYELFQLYIYYSKNYFGKRLSKQLKEQDFENSRVCLTDESIASYSDYIDLRLSWKRITQIIHTDELIVLFGTSPQCIVMTKKSLTEEELQAVELKLESSFSGSVITL